MLYTFSKSHYDHDELMSSLQHLTSDDLLLFWLDGVLLPIKYPELFNKLENIQVILDADLQARNIAKILQQKAPQIISISMEKCVDITVQHSPQIAY